MEMKCKSNIGKNITIWAKATQVSDVAHGPPVVLSIWAKATQVSDVAHGPPVVHSVSLYICLSQNFIIEFYGPLICSIVNLIGHICINPNFMVHIV
jgi:hypothetical protein